MKLINKIKKMIANKLYEYSDYYTQYKPVILEVSTFSEERIPSIKEKIIDMAKEYITVEGIDLFVDSPSPLYTVRLEILQNRKKLYDAN